MSSSHHDANTDADLIADDVTWSAVLDRGGSDVLEALIRAHGEQAAFNAIARRYVTDLVRYAYRFVHARESAEDIVQDVLCRMWDSRATLAIRGSVRDYLFGAVRLRALEVLRSARSAATREARYIDWGNLLTSVDDTLAIDVEQRELAAAIHQAIQALPRRRREILALRWRQLTTAEIATVLGISVKTVEAQITSAYATLREHLHSWIR
jgi:RNA polymerase sigma-70 factor (ECF subfamily)